MTKELAEVVTTHFHEAFVKKWGGCQNTPKKGSRYCTEHNDHATKFRDDKDGAAETTEEIDTVIIKILAERGTRQGKNYEVKYCKINN